MAKVFTDDSWRAQALVDKSALRFSRDLRLAEVRLT